MAINTESRFIQKFMSFINHYDHEKYWKRREVVVNPDIPASRIKRLYYLFYIKKVDSYWHCTFGTNYLEGSKFITPPILWHGPNGIIMGYNVSVGRDCIICQRVTMGYGRSIVIGDNVMKLSQRIQSLRVKCNLTQKELGNIINVSVVFK